MNRPYRTDAITTAGLETTYHETIEQAQAKAASYPASVKLVVVWLDGERVA